MAETPIIIHEQQFQRIKTVLVRLCIESAARVVFLIDRDGQPIAVHGDLGDMDTTSFASLAAGNVAATSSMANLIGEDSFPTLAHEGEHESIFISIIGRSLLVVIFDNNSTLGLVKLRTKKASYEILDIVQDIVDSSAKEALEEDSFLSQISDDEIDSLFS
jgi:predicted regulator of Ras-like GTPase activity (Roadblock/LC7/MglB family)